MRISQLFIAAGGYMPFDGYTIKFLRRSANYQDNNYHKGPNIEPCSTPLSKTDT